MTKVTRERRSEIVAIGLQNRNGRSRWPHVYIAAIYGISRGRVSKIIHRAGVRHRYPATSIACRARPFL